MECINLRGERAESIASTYAVNVQNCFHWKGDANFLVQKT